MSRRTGPSWARHATEPCPARRPRPVLCLHEFSRPRALRGAARPRAQVVSVSELLTAPERYNGSTLAVEGTVDQVCAKKGCWMTLKSGAREMRITFEDYGFFVSLDS
ncbi:MAG: DUF4920 domain-containing protein [Planctomycetes bacterium]|nr:DUF4920 domain-containing protein [Planctomycetota bacterium]